MLGNPKPYLPSITAFHKQDTEKERGYDLLPKPTHSSLQRRLPPHSPLPPALGFQLFRLLRTVHRLACCQKIHGGRWRVGRENFQERSPHPQWTQGRGSYPPPIRALYATPTPQTPLLATAATSPAHRVPCLPGSRAQHEWVGWTEWGRADTA